MKRAGFLLLTCAFVFISGCDNSPRLYKESRVMMGTFVEVISPDNKAAGIAFGEIKRIEDLLSKYNQDSEVSRLNSAGQLKVSRETYYIITRAKEFWLLSNGAFDITVGPLVELWGFKDKKYYLPLRAEIVQTLKRVGTDKIILNPADNLVKFAVPGMQIDLGAIAKGYAVDCAVRKLRENAIGSCLINAGGQVYCLGLKSGKPWVVAIADPGKKGISGKLRLVNKAVATSGAYEQFFIKGGVSYGHIFDPRTGMPADSGVASVTVVSDDSLTADALTTAIFVLGQEKGTSLAEKFPGVKIKIIKEKNG
jgi:FAD:protein FMN transferase